MIHCLSQEQWIISLRFASSWLLELKGLDEEGSSWVRQDECLRALTSVAPTPQDWESSMESDLRHIKLAGTCTP